MSLKMYEPDELSTIKHTIAIAAGKGGVGKSTITVNLALALQQKGFKVGIMDTDLYGPSIRKMLREDRMPGQEGQILIPAICQGISMISMAYFRKTDEAAAVRAPIANNIITQFIQQVKWGKLDYLLVDFPPGTGDIQLTLAQKANILGALMVTTPQEVAVMDVRKAMNLFNQVRTPIIGIVENMSHYQHPLIDEKIYLFGKGGGNRLAVESGLPFLGEIPIDPALCKSGDEGMSIFNKNFKSNSTEVFSGLAERVIKQVDNIQQEMKDSLTNFEITWKEF